MSWSDEDWSDYADKLQVIIDEQAERIEELERRNKDLRDVIAGSCSPITEPVDELEYYIASENEYDIEDNQRGPFVVICSHSIDGNVADVYGDTLADARDKAQLIIDLLNVQDDF